MQRYVKWLAFLLFTLASFSIHAQTQANSAGQVIVTTGQFQAVQANNQIRVLQRGSAIYPGDTLVTNAKSTAQIRFADGSVMALNANTRIKIDQYNYNPNDPKADTSVLSLIKGGFRALTGALGKRNPQAYKIETPVSVIGVRGTNFGGVLDKGRLYTGVWKGIIYVKNDGGLLQLGQGEDYSFAQVNSMNEKPIGLLTPPSQLIGQCSARNPDF